MPTLAVHYDLHAARFSRLPSDEEMTGLMIDQTELLGWNQGFDPEDRDSWTWQVTEVARLSSATGLTYSIQVNLPRDRPARAPWAGITTSAHALLERWGLEDPAGYSFGFDPADTTLRQPTGLEFFDRVPASPGTSARVSLFAAHAQSGDDDLLTTLLTEVGEVVTGLPSHLLHEVQTDRNAPPLPEFHGTVWNHVATLGTRLRAWGPLLAGALASTMMVTAQELHVPGPLMVHLYGNAAPTT